MEHIDEEEDDGADVEEDEEPQHSKSAWALWREHILKPLNCQNIEWPPMRLCSCSCFLTEDNRYRN
jgi:hypothetical protein